MTISKNYGTAVYLNDNAGALLLYNANDYNSCYLVSMENAGYELKNNVRLCPIYPPGNYSGTGSFNQEAYGANMLCWAAGGLGEVTANGDGCTLFKNNNIIKPSNFIVYGDSCRRNGQNQWFAMEGVSAFEPWGFECIHLRHNNRANVAHMDRPRRRRRPAGNQNQRILHRSSRQRESCMRREFLKTWIGGFAALFVIASPIVAAEDLPSVVIPEVPVSAVTGETMEIHGGGTGLWQGNIPPSLRTYECGTTGNLCQGSLTVRSNGRVLREGTDYHVDWKYSKIAFPPESGLPDGALVALDYRYRQRRIDSLVRQADGTTLLLVGTPALNRARPPRLPEGDVLLANYFTDYDGTVHCYPVRPPVPSGSTPGRIPQTVEKIRAGKPVKIVCWGDSVTAGGEAEAAYRYPEVLRRMLAERFPRAQIELEVVAVPGSNSSNWLWPKTHAFGKSDWQRVADAHPDLIVLEFVNDAWIDRANLEKLYRDLLGRCKQLNAELILITPHFTHPEMMDFKDVERTDRRPYTAFLREFAAQNHLAVADASRRWENLAAEGIPYVVLLANSINHPDADGHRIFAEEVIQCFEPENK